MIWLGVKLYVKREDGLVPYLANQATVEIIPLYRQVMQMQRFEWLPCLSWQAATAGKRKRRVRPPPPHLLFFFHLEPAAHAIPLATAEGCDIHWPLAGQLDLL